MTLIRIAAEILRHALEQADVYRVAFFQVATLLVDQTQ
jgi:hypothetical protein